MRFIFTGAQGTGKTTVLNHFKEADIPVITEVVRNLAKEGIKINEQGDMHGQQVIYSAYIDKLSEETDYISDRGLTDVLAYTYYLMEQGHVPATLAKGQLDYLKQFNEKNPDIVYFYFPIEFPVIDDSVRSTNEEFRKRIDMFIQAILSECKITYVTVTGTVEERIKIIENAMYLDDANRVSQE